MNSRRMQVEAWYEQHGRALLAYAVSLVGDFATAEDLLQQLFLRLLDDARIRPTETRPYLFRAMRNAAFNSRRTAVRNVPLEEQESWLETPAHLMDAGLTVQKGLRELPPEQREIIVLRVWGEMKLEEIASILEIPMNTVASRYRYGIARLKEMLSVRKQGEI